MLGTGVGNAVRIESTCRAVGDRARVAAHAPPRRLLVRRVCLAKLSCRSLMCCDLLSYLRVASRRSKLHWHLFDWLGKRIINFSDSNNFTLIKNAILALHHWLLSLLMLLSKYVFDFALCNEPCLIAATISR